MSPVLRHSLLLYLCGVGGLFGTAAAAQTPSSTPPHATVTPPAPFDRELTGDRLPRVPGLEGYRWYEYERGWVVSDDTVRAREILDAVRTAASLFERIFDQPVARGLAGFSRRADRASMNSALQAAEKQLGTQWGMILQAKPGHVGFPGATDSAGLVASRPDWEQEKREVLQELRPELTEAQLQDTLAQLWKTWVPYQLHDDSHLRHELAHDWFRQAYPWPGLHAGAPWFNEMVSILMYTKYHAGVYREYLLQRYEQDSATLVPLGDLFTMPHPVNGGDVDAYGFYAQLSSMIDFLVEQTKDSTVFRAIAENEAKGATMAEWLQHNGPRYGLPATVEALDQQWQQWFARFAKNN